MATLNKDEYGQVVYAKMGEDVSTATDYSFILEPKRGTKQTKAVADGVALGTTNIYVNDELHEANKYLTYTVKEGDLDVSGIWRKRGEATMSETNVVIGDYDLMSVLD